MAGRLRVCARVAAFIRSSRTRSATPELLQGRQVPPSLITWSSCHHLYSTGALDDSPPRYGVGESNAGSGDLQGREEWVATDGSRVILDQDTREQLNMHDMQPDARDLLEEDTAKMEDSSFDNDHMLLRRLSELEKLPIMLVRCSYNNTYINICDHTGRLLTWKSAGSEGYKNSRKGTTFAAQAVGLSAALKAREFGIHKVRVKLKGLGVGRQYSLKGFELGGLKVASIQDVTPVPHNGCKPRKKRRV